jgi:hypothetical protein
VSVVAALQAVSFPPSPRSRGADHRLGAGVADLDMHAARERFAAFVGPVHLEKRGF